MRTDHRWASVGRLLPRLLPVGICNGGVEGEKGTRTALLSVVDAGGLEDLGEDRDGRVDRVGDDEREGLGAVGGDALCEVAADAGVDLRETGEAVAGQVSDGQVESRGVGSREKSREGRDGTLKRSSRVILRRTKVIEDKERRVSSFYRRAGLAVRKKGRVTHPGFRGTPDRPSHRSYPAHHQPATFAECGAEKGRGVWGGGGTDRQG